MSIIKPKRVEDYIINHLKSGPKKSLDLVGKVKIDRPNTTKQAVYAALRLLKAQEQIITVKGIASLNVAWVNQMIGFFDSVQDSYTGEKNRGSFLDLEDKERIKYYFRDAHKADIFWTHAYYLLLEQLEEQEPAFLYNPHEWFIFARNENEKTVIKFTTNKGHPFLITVGGNTFLDKQAIKYFNNSQSQYNMLSKPLFRENNYYVNIFGDFLIEVWLDKKVTQEVENIYTKTELWNEDVEKEFQKTLALNGRTIIVISRNRKKAQKIKKSLIKGFAISNKSI